MIADAGLTLAWQEPVSAFLAGRQQASLERQLDDAAELAARDARALVDLSALDRLDELAARQARRVRRGEAIGKIHLPSLDRSYVMAEGTDTATLRKGPSHYPDTPLPGQRGTVAVAGHRTTYGAPFRTIDDLRPGDPVVLEMPYGRFSYRVERTRIVRPEDLSVKRKVRYDRLIMSACHPLYSAARRIVVFARLARAEPV